MFALLMRYSPNFTIQHYGTPLHWAVEHKRVEMLRTMMETNPDITVRDHNEKTVADLAIEREKKDPDTYSPMVDILRGNIYFPVDDKSSFPLHYAATRADAEELA